MPEPARVAWPSSYNSRCEAVRTQQKYAFDESMKNVNARIRHYRPSDASATARTFQAAIKTTAARHYSPAQIEAWGGGDIDLDLWNQRREASWTIVAELDGVVMGFSDLTPDGELDMLFVHPDAGGRGIAHQLVSAVLDEGRQRGLRSISTRASRTARPTFEALGFVVNTENPHNMIRGVTVPNFDMHLDL